MLKELEMVYGLRVGLCAWCLTSEATTHYIGTQAGGEEVDYQVCVRCYDDFN